MSGELQPDTIYSYMHAHTLAHSRVPRAVDPVTWLYFALLMLLFAVGVDGEQQQQKQATHQVGGGGGGEYNPAAKFIQFAQVISSLMEFSLEGAGRQSLMDKLRQLSVGAQAEKRIPTTKMYKPERQKVIMHVEEAFDVPEVWQRPHHAPSSGRSSRNTSLQCTNGQLAVPVNVGFICGERKVTSEEYSLMNNTEQETCLQESETGAVCVCPLGKMWLLQSGMRDNICANRLLLVSTRLEDRFLCGDDYGDSLGLPRHSESDFCLRVGRNEALELTLNISFRWMENDEMAQHSAQKGTVNNFGSPSGGDALYVTLEKGVIGNYNMLSRSAELFSFSVQPDESAPDSFGVPTEHPVEMDGTFEHIIFPFAHMELLEEERYNQMLVEDSTMEEFFGGGKNFTLHAIRRDLSKVSEEFVTANSIYMEIGFSSSGIPFDHRYARVWITFDDPPLDDKKKYRYEYTMSSAMMVAIVIVVAVVAGILIAIGWCLCHREHDVDDRLVSNALKLRDQRKKKE